MQEPYPRSQSVLQTRSSSFQTTASRILHKFSNFKVRIGNNSRNNKSIDDNDKNPYRETRSMDLDMHVTKPYMSQPMLSIPNMLHENDNDSSGSSPRSMHMPSRRPVDGLPQTSFDVARIKHRYQAQLENEPEVPSSRKRPTTSDSTATITPQSTHPPPPLPPITMTSTTNVPSPQASLPKPNPTPAPRPPTTPHSTTLPSRRPSIPRLTQPLPGRRFSLVMSENESASARLSPSIIIRQPALPILHLPTLKIPPPPESDTANADDNSGDTSPKPFVRRMSGMINIGSPVSDKNERRQSIHHIRAQSRRNLRAMPALPMAGSDQPNDGDNDDTDESDGDEDEDDTDGDAEGEGEGEDEEEDEPRRSSVSTESRTPLPEVDVSRLDLSFLNFPPESKGKERAKFDDLTTPTAAGPSSRTPRHYAGTGTSTSHGHGHDYFSVHYGSSGSDSRGGTPRTPSHAPRTPSVAAAKTPSIIQTPKATSPRLSELAELALPLSQTPPIPRPGMYQRASRSMVDLLTTPGIDGDGVLDSVNGIKRPKTPTNTSKTTTAVMTTNVKSPHAGTSGDPPPEAEEPSPLPLSTHSDALTISEEPRDPRARKDTLALGAPPYLSQEQHLAHIQAPAPRPPSAATLIRRRSMPTFNVASPPPPYPSFVLEYNAHPHPHQPPPPSGPHPDEGNERLPPYTNDIHLRAIMPRKLEFTKPGVQSKDRKWRKVVCELEGTVFRVYRCPPEYAGTGRVTDWWERKVGVGDMSVGVGVGGAGSNAASAGAVSATIGVGGTRTASEEERSREQERLRAEKIESESAGRGAVMHTEIALPPPSPVMDRSASMSRGMSSFDGGARDVADAASISQPPPSRSRLGLGNLLKAPKSHKRTQSEFPRGMGQGNNTSAASRSSFNLSRPSFGSSTSASAGNLSSATSNSSLSVSIPSSASSSGPGSSVGSAAPTPTTSHSTFSNANTNRFPKGITCPPPSKNDLMRAYTLQQAESGLGNDYLKRKNVIRVRLEGEQFLLQARDVTDVVDWIEGLHSATNIALDLDERPMPRGPLFPRRRRRRVRRSNTETGAQHAPGSVTVAVSTAA